MSQWRDILFVAFAAIALFLLFDFFILGGYYQAEGIPVVWTAAAGSPTGTPFRTQGGTPLTPLNPSYQTHPQVGVRIEGTVRKLDDLASVHTCHPGDQAAVCLYVGGITHHIYMYGWARCEPLLVGK